MSGRTPHGVRGLKSPLSTVAVVVPVGRTPHGVRGLKSELILVPGVIADVAPLTGCVD